MYRFLLRVIFFMVVVTTIGVGVLPSFENRITATIPYYSPYDSRKGMSISETTAPSMEDKRADFSKDQRNRKIMLDSFDRQHDPPEV